MQQYFIKQRLQIHSFVVLESEASFHITTVMRMKEKDKIRLVDDDHQAFLAEIETLGKQVSVLVVQHLQEQRELPVQITLLAGLIKKERWDWLIQKCTELGVSRIVPFESTRTVVKAKEEKLDKKLQRWQKIAQEAAEQSKRNSIPMICEPIMLKQAQQVKSNQNFIAYENAEIQGGQLHQLLQKGQSVTLVIGPEGGFSEQEVAMLVEWGYQCCSLGKRILRAETAAIYSLCAVNFVMEGDEV